MTYLLLKLAHLLAVMMFMGNIVTGLFWHIHASRTRDPGILAHTMRGIILSDRLFTLPGVFLIIVLGVATAMQGNLPLLRTDWILWSLILFSVSGISFMARVAPLQRRLLSLAERAGQGGAFDCNEYARVTRQWELWGAVALVTPLAAVVLMVVKPSY
jgi:uncharacterized membrane protein